MPKQSPSQHVHFTFGSIPEGHSSSSDFVVVSKTTHHKQTINCLLHPVNSPAGSCTTSRLTYFIASVKIFLTFQFPDQFVSFACTISVVNHISYSDGSNFP